MAKKGQVAQEEAIASIAGVDEIGPDYAPKTDIVIDGDFNVEEEFKPTPLIPPRKGYHANVVGVKYNPEIPAIEWTFCLADNGGFKSDGETPVDGTYAYYSNYLPKPGDENEMTKSGKMTKRQAKINMLKDFSERMHINMGTPRAIMTALQNQDWVGMSVILEIIIDSWEGRPNNKAKTAAAS